MMTQPKQIAITLLFTLLFTFLMIPPSAALTPEQVAQTALRSTVLMVLPSSSKRNKT